MGQIIEIPNVGPVEFPDGMDDNEILNIIDNEIIPNSQAGKYNLSGSPAPPPEEEKDDSFWGDVENVFRGIGAGFTQTVPLAVEGAAGLAYSALGDLVPAPDESSMVRWGRETRKSLTDFFGGDAQSDAYGVGNALGSFASFFVPYAGQAGLVAKGLGVTGKIVGYGGAGSLAIGSGAGEQVDRILRMSEQLGKEVPGADQRLSIAWGGAIGLTELAGLRIPAGIILSKIPRNTNPNVVKRILGSLLRSIRAGGEEGTQEAIAGILQDLVEKHIYNPDLEIGESVAGDFGYGASAGAIFNAGLELMLPRRRGGVFGQLDKPPAAEDQVVPDEVVPAGQYPRIEPLAQLPPPAPVLLLEDHRPDSEKVVPLNENIVDFAQQTVQQFAADLPLTFNRGVITVDETGTPDVYQVKEADLGFFVETKDGVRASPKFTSREQAEIFRSELNFGVQDILTKQDEIETETLAREAVGKAKSEEMQQLLAAARATITPVTADFGLIDDQIAININKRLHNLGKQTLTAGDPVALEDLEDAGVSKENIESILPPVNLGTTTDDIRGLAAEKNIKIDDAGFERYASRVAGHKNYEVMLPTQLDYLGRAMAQLPVLPGDGPRSLPSIMQPIFNAAQYQTAISAARNMDARLDRNLRRGEVLASDIGNALGLKRGGAPTQSIIEEAVKRGDLIPSDRKNAYMHRDEYAAPVHTTPLTRGEPIEAEAREAARVEEEAQSDEAIRERLGGREGIIIRRADAVEPTGDLLTRSRAFKERLNRATVRKEAATLFGDENAAKIIGDWINKRMSRYGKSIPNFDPDAIVVDFRESILNDGRRVEGQIDEVDGRIVISLALDMVPQDAVTPEKVAQALSEVLDHEIVHALKRFGVISEAEWSLLTKFVKKRRPTKSGVEREKTWYEEADDLYRNDLTEQYANSQSPNYIENETERTKTIEEAITEEAIANSFRDWVAGRGVSGKPQSIFRRIVDFFIGLKNGLTNINITDSNQVFENWRGPRTARTAEGAAPTEATEQERAASTADAERLRQTESDVPQFSLSRPPLASLAEKVLGTTTVREGNVVRGARFSDVTRAVRDRELTGRLTREEEEDKRDLGRIVRQYSLPRNMVNKKDTAFTARNPVNDTYTLNNKPVPPRGRTRRLSAIDILYNPEFSLRSKQGMPFVAELLNQRGLRVLKEPVQIEKDTSKDGLISDALALEYKAHVKNGDKASGWYSERLEEALETAAIMHPEIATDPDARFAFIVSLAITSQNTDVWSNARYANEVYNEFKNTGVFPLFAKGKHASSMRGNFDLLNQMIRRFDNSGGISAVRELFNSPTTVRDLKNDGYSPPTGEAMDEEVYGSYLLGPKIGQGFYQNLNGNFDPLTIDMWLMRTIGRMTGRLVGNPDQLPEQTARLYFSLLGPRPSLPQTEDAVVRMAEAMETGDTDAIIELADELRLEHDRLFRTPEVRALYDAKKYKKPEWALSAEAIVTSQLKPNDSPTSSGYRRAVRRIVGKAIDKLERDGISTTVADFQAVVWYPEKRLAEILGARVKDLNVDYAQAMEEVLNESQGDLRAVERGRRAEAGAISGRDIEAGRELGQADREAPTPPQFSVSRSEGAYPELRGRGMSVSLVQGEDMSFLTIRSAGQRIEVRGQAAIGADYQGGPLDQVINSIPRKANLSSLFAGETLDLPPEWTDPIIDALERVEIEVAGGFEADPSMPTIREDRALEVRRRQNEALLQYIKENPEGFTVRLDGSPGPETGYVVAPIKAAETVIIADDLNLETINMFSSKLIRATEATNKEVLAGGWLNNEDGKYYLDGVHVYEDLDTALYIADSAEQIAIFDLGARDEIRTEEGIEGLRNSGAYNDQARNDSRRSVEDADRRFRAARPPSQPQFSVPRRPTPTEVEAEVRGLKRYLGAFKGKASVSDLKPHFIASKFFDYNGILAPVVIPTGYDELNARTGETVGFGIAHAKKHLDDVVRNSPYNSIEDLLEAAMGSYASGVLDKNSIGAYGQGEDKSWRNSRHFGITEGSSVQPGLAPALKMQWVIPDTNYGFPAVFIFQPLSYDAITPNAVEQDPSKSGQYYMLLKTAWAGPSKPQQDKPVVLPARNPPINPELNGAVQRGVNDAVNRTRPPREVLTLKKKFSLPRSRDSMSREDQDVLDRNIEMGVEETFWDKILRTFKASDPDDHTFATRFRAGIAAKEAGVDVRTRQVQAKRKKERGEDYQMSLDSSASSAFALLSRKAGVVSAGLIHGPVIRDRGRIYAITEKLLNHPIAKVREEYRKAWERLVEETAYIDPVTKKEVRYESPSDIKGLVNIMAEVDQQGLWAQFFLYSAAYRARRLRAEGREKTFSVEDEAAGLKMGENNPAIMRAHREYQLWNNSAINVMRDSGVISQEAADLWKENADYLPFYRELYDNVGVNYTMLSPDGVPTKDTLFTAMNDPNNRMFDSFYGVKTPHELRGGKPIYRVMVNNVADSMAFTGKDDIALKNRIEYLEEMNKGAQIRVAASNQRIADPLNNMLRNFDAAITSSMQNIAVSRAVRDLGELGLAKRLDADHLPGDVSPTQIGLKVRGETRYYEVADSLLLNAIKASDDTSMPGLSIQAIPSTLLRELVTKEPAFMAANMLRDTFSAWVTSGVNIIPIAGTLKGYGEALMGTASAEALAASGATGGYDFKGDPKNALKAFKKHLRMKQPYKPRNVARAIWEYADRISGASDTSTRVAVYNRVLKETGDETSAILEALEVINFSRKGSNPVVRYMTAVVPFLNARIQGLDVLYRGATGQMTTRVPRQKRMLSFYLKASLIVALTAAYHAYHMSQDEEEDPWYYKAAEYEKDNYWILPPTMFGFDVGEETPALRIPIPFEVGVLFKVIPERIMQLIDDQTDGKELFRAARRHAFTTFNVGLPQWASPIAGAVNNRNEFTGRPIVNYWSKQNESWLADPLRTSPLAKTLAEAFDEVGVRFDAEKIDHLFRGYTGTLGSYALMMADSAMRNATGMPDRPERRLDERIVIGRFLQQKEGRGPVQQFYDIANELDIFNNTLSHYEKFGDAEGFDEYLTSRDDLVPFIDYVEDVKKYLSEIRAQRMLILNDDSYSPEEKREAIADLDVLTNEILEGFKGETKNIRVRQ